MGGLEIWRDSWRMYWLLASDHTRSSTKPFVLIFPNNNFAFRRLRSRLHRRRRWISDPIIINMIIVDDVVVIAISSSWPHYRPPHHDPESSVMKPELAEGEARGGNWPTHTERERGEENILHSKTFFTNANSHSFTAAERLQRVVKQEKP